MTFIGYEKQVKLNSKQHCVPTPQLPVPPQKAAPCPGSAPTRPRANGQPPAPFLPGRGAAPVKRGSEVERSGAPFSRAARPAAAMGCERGAALLLLPLALQLCPGRAAPPAPRGKVPAPPLLALASFPFFFPSFFL